MKRLVLIDGNNWGFAGNGKAPLYSGDRQTQAIYYVINRIREVYEQYPEAQVMVLWDGRSWRFNLYPEYKGNREVYPAQIEMKENYVKQRPYIQKALELLGVTQVSAANMEADDLAAILTKNSIAKNVPVLLLTADEDWQQLVQRGARWFDVIRSKSCQYASFVRDTGFKDRAQFVEAKCILGDRGDNIFGIKGIGPKTLENIYTMWPSFKDFLDTDVVDCHDLWVKKFGKKYPKVLVELDREEARRIIKNNMMLVDLYTEARPMQEDRKVVRKPLDEEGFKQFCRENAFHGIARTIDEFVLPFKGN